MKRIFILFWFLCVFSTCIANTNGIELSITFSGKLFLGIGYRHQIDPNTAIRVGASTAIIGTPVGFNMAILQDTSPLDKWTPFFGIGANVLLYKKNKNISHLIYPNGTAGISYCPQTQIRHNAEFNLALFTHNLTLKPVSIKYVYFNTVL